MMIAEKWLKRECHDRGLEPLSTERELLGIISQLEKDNEELRKQLKEKDKYVY